MMIESIQSFERALRKVWSLKEKDENKESFYTLLINMLNVNLVVLVLDIVKNAGEKIYSLFKGEF